MQGHDLERPTITVIVPTFRRPEALLRCLGGVAAQTELAETILVVVRADDRATAAALARPGVPPHQVATVVTPGVVAAMAQGAERASTDLVAFCDDDAIPRPDWVARLRRAFLDPKLGAIGGRDVLGHPHPTYPPTENVGRLGRWGRVSGNHHRGTGAPRHVEVLKAVNMAYRREALAFPMGLRGAGAQVHFELPMALWAQQRGWAVVYDPALLVDHHPEPRFDADRRGRPDLGAVEDAAFNLTLGLLSLRPNLQRRRTLYGLGLGDRGTPGVGRAAIALMRRDAETMRRLWPSLTGQVQALRQLGAAGPLRMHPVLPAKHHRAPERSGKRASNLSAGKREES